MTYKDIVGDEDPDFAWTSKAQKSKPEIVPQRRAGDPPPAPLKKYRVTYVAVKRQRTYRAQEKTGQLETLHDEITFREETSVIIQASSPENAVTEATKHLPAECELTYQVGEVSK